MTDSLTRIEPLKFDIKTYLEDVVASVEATSFEQYKLWQEMVALYGSDYFVSTNFGYLSTVGYINDRPICISLNTAIVNGKKILFWYATSQVVDYIQIEKWLLKNLPKSAFRGDDSGDYIISTDPMNFSNIL